ncbi:SAM-dependent methyltransferase [Actinomadura algeriensis]|uniref:S-adenosyl methyltransferase n=1 Tax=Actinomadura algeriensis TaxID=1679523 RepID=A0ABR9JTU1_9ACTN|nr:SAM-dependent methyltransferase [Actinomadura algeriensis]MBE1533982.1 hypothetical protein [Actinomadura algeriensis]
MPNFDSSIPNIARIYDAMLGGKDNFAVDREAADRLVELEPLSPLYAREHRRYIGRAIEVVAGRGVRQFLDVGTGLPTMDNVHQIAQRRAPGSRVVYVDNDPNVCAHARALLADDVDVAVVEEDLRRPERILAGAAGSMELDEPMCVLVTGVLHFVPDDDDPFGAVGCLVEAMAPGSFLVISHITDERVRDTRPSDNRSGLAVYARSNAPMHPRNRVVVERFLRGLEVVDPGITCISEWANPDPPLIHEELRGVWLAAVARKP